MKFLVANIEHADRETDIIKGDPQFVLIKLGEIARTIFDGKLRIARIASLLGNAYGHHKVETVSFNDRWPIVIGGETSAQQQERCDYITQFLEDSDYNPVVEDIPSTYVDELPEVWPESCTLNIDAEGYFIEWRLYIDDVEYVVFISDPETFFDMSVLSKGDNDEKV